MALHWDSVPVPPLAPLPPGSPLAPRALPYSGIAQPSPSQGCSVPKPLQRDAEGGDVPKGHGAARSRVGLRAPGEVMALPRNVPHPRGGGGRGMVRTAQLAAAWHHALWPCPGLQPPTPWALQAAPWCSRGSALPHNIPPPLRGARPTGPPDPQWVTTGFLPAVGATASPGRLAGEEPSRLCNGQ